MYRSVTVVLCAAVVWAAGLSDAAEAGLKPQKRRQTEISSNTRLAIPQIVGDYVLIYKPQPDVYTGKDTKHYKTGQTYTNWQPKGHRFIKESRTQDDTADNLPEVTPGGGSAQTKIQLLKLNALCCHACESRHPGAY